MIIKIKKCNFKYYNNNLKEASFYKDLLIDIHNKLNWNYSIEKMIKGGWKAYLGLENNCKLANLVMWNKKKFLFETLVPLVTCKIVKFGVVTYLENRGEILSKFKGFLSCITSKLKAISPILFSL